MQTRNLFLAASILFNAIKLLILSAILYAVSAPPPILVTLGAPQTVRTANPKIGVHTRLTDEVEEWKIKKNVELVREMGAPWIVEYFPWGYIEYNENEYDWSHADQVVDHARRQGLTVIARLGFAPVWARPKNPITSYLDESRYPHFANFAREFVAHFKGRIRYVIIWNEPNVNLEWGYRPVDPAGYTRMLQAVYPFAKQADPEIQILAGALAPNLAPPGSVDAMNELEYARCTMPAHASTLTRSPRTRMAGRVRRTKPPRRIA
ncbi:MAG: beta-galactosidase [Chloroflexi bacterium]|nr:beta-galactosidase [Chloroflexota bacterium]